MTAHERPRTVCGAGAYLPSSLVVRALALETSAARPAEPEDVQRHLRCTLEHAPGTDHYALVLELDGPDTGSVWTSWPWGQESDSWQLTVLPDCSGKDGQPCNEFEGHDGGHSAEVYDPWADMSDILSS